MLYVESHIRKTQESGAAFGHRDLIPGRLTVVLSQLATETRSTTHLTIATALLLKKKKLNLSSSVRYKIMWSEKLAELNNILIDETH